MEKFLPKYFPQPKNISSEFFRSLANYHSFQLGRFKFPIAENAITS